VVWRAGDVLEQRAMDCVMSGQTDDPVIDYLRELRLIMKKALLEILVANGFVATAKDDPYSTKVIVTGGPRA
jgi:hypothetical protein